jgi:hypothetical protein
MNMDPSPASLRYGFGTSAKALSASGFIMRCAMVVWHAITAVQGGPVWCSYGADGPESSCKSPGFAPVFTRRLHKTLK